MTVTKIITSRRGRPVSASDAIRHAPGSGGLQKNNCLFINKIELRTGWVPRNGNKKITRMKFYCQVRLPTLEPFANLNLVDARRRESELLVRETPPASIFP
jgi:hypothetical protein